MTLTQSCYVTEGLGLFYFRYFGFFIAHDQSRPSVDPPCGCVVEFLQAR